MQSTKSWLSNLKLRLGFGTTGNDNIDDNMYATPYGVAYYTNGKEVISGLSPGSTVGNPNVKWEKTSTFNLGLDFGFFHGRLNGSLDYYVNKSSNLLIQNNRSCTHACRRQRWSPDRDNQALEKT